MPSRRIGSLSERSGYREGVRATLATFKDPANVQAYSSLPPRSMASQRRWRESIRPRSRRPGKSLAARLQPHNQAASTVDRAIALRLAAAEFGVPNVAEDQHGLDRANRIRFLFIADFQIEFFEHVDSFVALQCAADTGTISQHTDRGVASEPSKLSTRRASREGRGERAFAAEADRDCREKASRWPARSSRASA